MNKPTRAEAELLLKIIPAIDDDFELNFSFQVTEKEMETNIKLYNSVKAKLQSIADAPVRRNHSSTVKK